MAIQRYVIDGYGQVELNQVAFRRDGRVEAQCKLDDTDYITSKALDAITLADNLTSLLAALKSIRTEYADIITQRQSWREEINNLEKQMETI